MTGDLTTATRMSPADVGIGRLFQAVRDAVIVAHASSGQIVLWNPAAETVFGYTAQEAVGMSIEVLVPRRLQLQHREGLAHYNATGHGAIIDGRRVVEVPAVSRSGQEIVVELSLSPIEDASVAGRYVLAIVRDVTERSRLRTAADRQLRELQALYSADHVLHRSLRLDHILQGLVDVATEILRADKTSVLIWDEKRDRLVPGATRGFRPESIARMSHALGEGITGRVAMTNRPIAVQDAISDPRVIHQITDPEEIRSLLHVPIEVGGEVFGVFGVNYCEPREFTGDEQRLLESLAGRAALAIENARLYERAGQVAVLEERHRLARDLHDAVTQTLFAANLVAAALPDVWRVSADAAEQALADLSRLTRGALAEMRTLLLELRPAELGDSPLGELLRQLADAASGRSQFTVALHVTGQRQLPADVRVAFYRVAQEALNNIVKHAEATHVEMSLRLSGRGARLIIADNGKGFDIHRVPAGRLGLGFIRERAAGIDAPLTVNSEIGRGTRVQLVWQNNSFSYRSPREPAAPP
jgi:PAS domain S-box-containing protein